MKLQLIINDKCQLNCGPCIRSTNQYTKTGLMSFDKFTKILDIIPSLENLDLTPMIGDPLDIPNFHEYITHVNTRPYIQHFDMVTNLIGLNKKQLDAMCNSNKFGLFISVYGHDKESFLKFTGVDKFEQFEKSLKLLIEYIGAYKFVTFPIVFYLRNGDRKTFFSKNTSVSTYIKMLTQFNKRLYTIDDTTANSNFNWGGQFENVINKFEMPKDRPTPCLHLREQRAIFPNGDLTACGMVDVNKKMIIGNIFKDGPNILNKVYCNPVLCENCNEYEIDNEI